MKFRTVIRKNDIYVLLLIIMIVGSSWDALLGTSYLDEIALICLLGVSLLFRIHVDTLPLVCLLIYSMICLLGLLRGYGSLTDAFNYIKCMLTFVMIPALNLKNIDKKRIWNVFKLSNAISVAVGITNSVCYNVLHRNLIFESGNLKDIDGVLVHRMAGFCSFSGVMATICLCLLVVDLFKADKKFLDYFWVLYWLVGIYCTRGRVPLYSAVCIIAIYFWKCLPIKLRKKIFPFFFLTAILLCIIVIPSALDYIKTQFAEDFQNQIRWKVYLKYSEIFDVGWLVLPNLFLGVGCGYLGTVYESHFAITLIETGIVGLSAWYAPLIFYFVRLIRANRYTEKNLAVMVLLGFYLVNCFINKSYDVPFLPVMCVLLNGAFSKSLVTGFDKSKSHHRIVIFRSRVHPVI
ncbi:hypothetical protein ACTNEQ_14670 [Blautia obeum]|uniref:hypothetical protein n=1 Tax=Blautia obeum TaxID=40520 RepID=UPI003F8B98EB